MSELVTLSGITRDDIQNILTETLKKLKTKPGILFFDASYGYNFHPSDFVDVKKICQLVKYTNKPIEWHRYLERWYQDQTVTINGRPIKPIKIARALDLVPNEALEMTAQCWAGTDQATFKFHALGNGDVNEALASDTAMVNQISRIDVTTNANGSSLTRDGSTFYIIGNHPITVQSADITETGVFSSASTTTDIMLDHSVLDSQIDHTINSDVPGSTTIIYMCSS
ncbi:MAG TPA: hypothetical protein VL854_13775 [Nitrososphaeraceae archaeon]|nr:hypothetical protein [Nitrososphaeraceae archaeon]